MRRVDTRNPGLVPTAKRDSESFRGDTIAADLIGAVVSCVFIHPGSARIP